jgi:hypothetical protein
MGLKSHREFEKDAVATLPNGLTAIRAVGGLAVGIALATGNIDPGVALGASIGLAITDAEGSAITLTNRFKRLQETLRIIPSKFGRIFDPIADKVWAISTFGGATIGGEIPLWQGAGVMATELATSVATGVVMGRGGDVEAPKVGKVGMVARCGVVIADLASTAFGGHSGFSQELLADGGDAFAATAIALGSLSCATVMHRRNNIGPELPQLPAEALSSYVRAKPNFLSRIIN